MSILKIRLYPDPVLRTISKPVTDFTPELSALAADMAETMLSAPGAGLAAPQVGHPIRLIVIDARESREEEYGSKIQVLVNPEIVAASGSQEDTEGCLSVEDLSAVVERAEKVEVAYQDLEGASRSMEASGRLAVVLQHETDHLNGVLFIDYLSPLRREMYLKSLRKKQRGA
jgi:peptide deformylase